MVAALPIVKRIENAINNIGKANGHKLPDCEVPKDIAKSNEAADLYVRRHDAIKEAFIAQILNKIGAARWERAKKALAELIPDSSLKTAGESKAFVYDKMSLAVRSQRSGARINRAKLITKLVSDQKLSFEKANEFVAACEDEGVALYFTPATVAE